MQQQITLELDTKTIELANKFASYKGKSMSDLFDMYIRFIIFSETIYSISNTSFNNLINLNTNSFFEKETNWDELDIMIAPFRNGLPSDYKFDRDLANER